MIIAGIIARSRVIIRLSQGAILMFKNPSIITCPANVAVMVEFCPEASNANAKSVLAAPTPRSGESN